MFRRVPMQRRVDDLGHDEARNSGHGRRGGAIRWLDWQEMRNNRAFGALPVASLRRPLIAVGEETRRAGQLRVRKVVNLLTSSVYWSRTLMNDLVKRLSEGSHPVEIVIRPERNAQSLKECLERRYVHVKFTETRGGTTLGVKMDESVSREAVAAIDTGANAIRVVGDLTLDYVPVRCVADIDLTTY